MQCAVVHLTLKGPADLVGKSSRISNGHLSTHLSARCGGGRAFPSLCIIVSSETYLGNKIQTSIFSWNFLFAVSMSIVIPRKRRE